MYLKSSKYRMERKKNRRFNLSFLVVIGLAILGLAFFQSYIVPTVPTPVASTPTATRSAALFADEAAQLFQNGQLQASIEMYQQAILKDPINTDLYVALSRVQVFAGKYVDALESAQNAVLRSKSALSYAVFGNALHYLERYPEAEQELRQSLQLDPNLGLAHAYLAEELIDADTDLNWQAAEDEAKLALSLAPNLMEAHQAMAYVWMWTGNQELAIQEYNIAISMNSKLAQLWLPLGDMYLAQGDTNKAIDCYGQASALDPTNPDPQARTSRAYAGAGQYGKAFQYAQLALKNDPLNAKMHGLLGVMLYYNHDFAGAITELNIAISGGQIPEGTVQGLPIGPFPVSEYYWTLGLALAKVGRCAEAVPYLRLVQQTFPGDSMAQDNVNNGLLLCNEITPVATQGS
jgi:tetratricopeptide (TPR) repeat protein